MEGSGLSSPVLWLQLCVVERYVVHSPEFVQQHLSCEGSLFVVGLSFVPKEQLILRSLFVVMFPANQISFALNDTMILIF